MLQQRIAREFEVIELAAGITKEVEPFVEE